MELEDDYSMTALHLAAENGAYESVKVLSQYARQRPVNPSPPGSGFDYR